MDGPLPLPTRIPNPTDEQLMLLIAMGFAIDYTNYTEGDKYVEYDLPKEWKIIDDSTLKQSPLFSIVDEKQLERVKIYGSWPGHSGYLRMTIWKDPQPFISKKKVGRESWFTIHQQMNVADDIPKKGATNKAEEAEETKVATSVQDTCCPRCGNRTQVLVTCPKCNMQICNDVDDEGNDCFAADGNVECSLFYCGCGINLGCGRCVRGCKFCQSKHHCQDPDCIEDDCERPIRTDFKEALETGCCKRTVKKGIQCEGCDKVYCQGQNDDGTDYESAQDKCFMTHCIECKQQLGCVICLRNTNRGCKCEVQHCNLAKCVRWWCKARLK